ncbi:MAG: VanZ family protein [Halobacteria archaeon]|nr:VanZ family protein [Halobacteria archaeon]
MFLIWISWNVVTSMRSSISVPVLPRWLRWSSVAFVAGAIFYLSVIDLSQTGVPSESFVFDLIWATIQIPADKVYHVIAYAGLAATLAYATIDIKYGYWYVALGVVLLTAIYGVGIEVVQSTVSYRSFDVADILTNALGASTVSVWYVGREYVGRYAGGVAE